MCIRDRLFTRETIWTINCGFFRNVKLQQGTTAQEYIANKFVLQEGSDYGTIGETHSATEYYIESLWLQDCD